MAETVALGTVTTKIGSGATPRGGKHVYRSSGVAFIRSQNVYDQRFSVEGLAFIDSVAADDLRSVSVEPGDVLLNITGDSVARCCIVPNTMLPARVSQHVMIVRPRRELVDSKYLEALLINPGMKAHLHALAGAGATRPALTKGHIESLQVPLPPLSEQRAIAEVLGALDDKIEANRRTIDRALAFAIQCVQSAILEAQLSDLALIRRNTLSPSSFSSDEVDHFSLPAFDDGQVPVREPGSNIKSGKQELTNTLVLVSKLNPHIPRIWYAMAQPGVRAVASTEFVCLQARGDATAEELWACCSTREFTEQLQERVTGTTGSHQRVRPEDMMTLTIADPTALPETTRSALREAVSLGEALRHEKQSLAVLRDVLLPRLMSGELRIREAEHLVEDAV